MEKTMRVNKKYCVAAVMAVMSMAALPNVANAQPTGTYRLTARVPVSCWVRPEQGPINSETGQGRVVEACNSPGGFSIRASYRALEAEEEALLRYGDNLIDLPAHGEVLLRRSSIAQIRTVDYRFEKTVLKAPIVMVLTIQPI